MPLSSVVGAQSIVRPGVCTSSTRPASPYDGQVIYMTDVDQTAVWDGSAWVVLAPIASGRNVVINGAMQIAQRGTSTASITTVGYYTADRWMFEPVTTGTWTVSVENDAPTGSGFRKSFKALCTTAKSSLSAGDNMNLQTRIEGQNLQQFLKGTSSAKPFSVSFWVKANATGTYIVELYDGDNTRQVSASYTISASGVWERKTITFPADTTGAFDNDNQVSLYFVFHLSSGTNLTSGTLNTAWASVTNANRVVGQTNLASATNNYWQVTGVQLEAGAVATPFEFEDYSETLAKCQRYYYLQASGTAQVFAQGFFFNTAQWEAAVYFPVTMRVAPTLVVASGSNYYNTREVSPKSFSSLNIARAHPNGALLYVATTGAATGDGAGMETVNAASSVAYSSEL